MRLEINLASQPYEDARQFWLRWGTALGLASISTLVLLALTITGWFAARHDHAAIASYRAQIAQRDQTRELAQQFLNRPENRSTRDESQFLNDLIARKSLSWTHVLEDLERVMPSRLHVVSIAPQLDDENQLTLNLVVAGDSRDKAIELAERMEESKHFSQTYIATERSATGEGTGDRVEFDINGVYVPQSDATPTSPTPVQAPSTTSAPARPPLPVKPKRSQP
jgi:type IV pilus assembly protein PilN